MKLKSWKDITRLDIGFAFLKVRVYKFCFIGALKKSSDQIFKEKQN